MCFYTGKELDKRYGEFQYIASKIVLSLLEGLLDMGYRLFIDNWYSSFEILHILH